MKKSIFALMAVCFLVGSTTCVATPLGFDNDDGIELFEDQKSFTVNQEEVLIQYHAQPVNLEIEAIKITSCGTVEILKTEKIEVYVFENPAMTSIDTLKSNKESDYGSLYPFKNSSTLIGSKTKPLCSNEYCASWYSCRK